MKGIIYHLEGVKVGDLWTYLGESSLIWTKGKEYEVVSLPTDNLATIRTDKVGLFTLTEQTLRLGKFKTNHFIEPTRIMYRCDAQNRVVIKCEGRYTYVILADINGITSEWLRSIPEWLRSLPEYKETSRLVPYGILINDELVKF